MNAASDEQAIDAKPRKAWRGVLPSWNAVERGVRVGVPAYVGGQAMDATLQGLAGFIPGSGSFFAFKEYREKCW